MNSCIKNSRGTEKKKIKKPHDLNILMKVLSGIASWHLDNNFGFSVLYIALFFSFTSCHGSWNIDYPASLFNVYLLT